MLIVHEHNTTSKKQLSSEDALEKMEGNILEKISNWNVEVESMKDEFLNMKDVIIKCLQDENESLCLRCSKAEDKVVRLNHQLIRLNNMVEGIT